MHNRHYKPVTGKSISKKEARKSFQKFVISNNEQHTPDKINPADVNSKEAWDKLVKETWVEFVKELHANGEIVTATKTRWIKEGF